MRARRREINIFNMSLIDILCGALGAFCFMMLVALPYYKPGAGSSAQVRENQQKTEELMRELEKLKESLGQGATADDLEELLRKLQAQIQSLQGQVNQLTAEKQQLADEKETLNNKLRAKKPFMVMLAGQEYSQELDLYVEDDLKLEKQANPPFNPSKKHHEHYWTGDRSCWANGVTLWMVADMPANVHYKIYAKLANEPADRKATSVYSLAFGGNFDLNIPQVTLTPERFWTLVGTLTCDQDYKMTIKEATAPERDAEWTRVMKTAPPPIVVPTAAPQATTVPSATVSDQREEMLKKLRKDKEQSSGGQSSPTQKSSEEQRREMLEKLKRGQQASPPPESSEQRDLIQKRQDRQLQISPAPSASP